MTQTENLKPVILGVEGKKLTEAEKELFKKHRPFGFILFSRNIENPEQVKALTDEMYGLFPERKNVIITIDQEGGRVARLKEPHWRKMPPAKDFKKILDTRGMEDAKRAVYENYLQCAKDLRAVGINMNCAPTLDLEVSGADGIIGDRAFSHKPNEISMLAEKCAHGLLDGGVLPIIKHIPGHGRATADSHKELPVVMESVSELWKTDFVPFKALNKLPYGMTAHIKYSDICDRDCATQSKVVIDFIRNEIGFGGLLMTDDLSMHALTGSFADRVKKSVDAGCDILLHCNGDMREMTEVCEATEFAPNWMVDKLNASIRLID